jgi:predicted transcriptional regulator
MMTLEKIREALDDRNLKLVSERSGVPYQVLLRIKKGETQNPAYNTTKALSDYLEGKEKTA